MRILAAIVGLLFLDSCAGFNWGAAFRAAGESRHHSRCTTQKVGYQYQTDCEEE